MESEAVQPVVPLGNGEWFTIHSHPKHEHIAAANLERMHGIEVWNPKIAFTRLTRRGAVNVVESVFPGYIFARFTLEQSLDAVRYTPGVASVVHFADRYPTLCPTLISHLKSHFNGGDKKPLVDDLVAGETVMVTNGGLRGIEAVVLRVLPARERVKVLLELLGTTAAVELNFADVAVLRRHPRSLAA